MGSQYSTRKGGWTGMQGLAWAPRPPPSGAPLDSAQGTFPCPVCVPPQPSSSPGGWRQERGRSYAGCWGAQLWQRELTVGTGSWGGASLPEVDGSGEPGLRFTLNPRKSPKLEKCSIRHRSLSIGAAAAVGWEQGQGAHRLPAQSPAHRPHLPPAWGEQPPRAHAHRQVFPRLLWVTRN